MASIAAGQPGAHFFGGVAPEAKIVIVIPNLQVGATDPYSLGYSTSHVDALTYIKDLAKQKDLPVVVNLSQGMNAGAHDGTSLLEAAFDEFSGGGREPGYVVVKSAGNERGYDGHAKLYMANQGTDSLRWDSKQTHRGPDIIELWFKACDKMRFRLHNPRRASSHWVTLVDNIQSGQFSPSGNKYEIFYDRYYTDNGDSRLLINIWKGVGTGIEVGTWELEIVSPTVQSQGEVHAWIERNDYRHVGFINNRNDEVTLSIPGTARTVISVGSVDASTPLRWLPIHPMVQHAMGEKSRNWQPLEKTSVRQKRIVLIE